MYSSEVIDKVLNVKYTLPNGELTAVIVKNRTQPYSYDCLLCSVQRLSPPNLIQHVSGRRHLQKIELVDIETERTPLQRVLPPHHTDPTSKLRRAVNETTNKAIIGMEWILEVYSISNLAPSFHCVLCGEIFNLINRVVDHLSSYNHRTNYLKSFFPRVYEEVYHLIELVCKGIEDEYGRPSPVMVERNEFLKLRNKFVGMASNSECIDEKIGCLQLIQKSVAKDRTDIQKRCVDIASISSDSSSSSSATASRQNDKLLSSRSTTTATKRDSKLETFWLEMDAAKNELVKAYEPFISNPPSYPGYLQLWESFWKTRYQELRAEDKLESYDWQSEWALEWRKLITEKIKKGVEAKSAEIKRKLGLSDASLSEIDNRNFQTTEISDDDVERPRRSQSPKTSQSRRRSRSRSPHRRSLDRNRSTSQQHETTTGLPKLTLNDCQTPNTKLRVEQLMEKHKHSGDFLISWRELLSIFEIEDSHGTPLPPTDCSEKTTDHMEVSESIGPAQQQPAESAEPETVISVLRILMTLEHMLGSLGSKLIYLLQAAIKMENANANSSNTLLNDNHNCILFETIQEKLKGLLTAGLVESNFKNIVKKTIKDMTNLVREATASKPISYMQPPSSESQPPSSQSFEMKSPQADYCTDKGPVLQPATKVIDAANDEDGSLTATLEDSEIKVLLEKFASLSAKNKCNFTAYLNRLKSTDPLRVMRLQSEVNVCKIEMPSESADNVCKKEMPEPAIEMLRPVTAVCIDLTASSENASYFGEKVDQTSNAYRLAKRNAGAKIKRRTRNSIA